MTTYLGKSCSFCLPRVPFVNCRQFMYLVISILVLRAGYGIWLYQFLIIAYVLLNNSKVEKESWLQWQVWRKRKNESSHEIMVLSVLRKLILQTRMGSHPVGLDVWFLVGHFVYLHTSCERTAKALARLHGCACSPEPSLIAYVISTIILWPGSFVMLIPSVKFQGPISNRSWPYAKRYRTHGRPDIQTCPNQYTPATSSKLGT